IGQPGRKAAKRRGCVRYWLQSKVSVSGGTAKTSGLTCDSYKHEVAMFSSFNGLCLSLTPHN
ncbi:MAG: hypothetical protein B7Z81_05905, partial [Acidocella sp. 20-61-6]